MKVERRAIDLPEEGPARIAVVADTHSQPHPRIAEHLHRRAPALILHGGDIGQLEVLAKLGEIAPVVAVRGNIDGHAPGVPDAITLELRRGGQLVLRIFLTHIAVYGPRLRAEVKKRAEAEGATVVVCGHSHVPFMTRDRGLVVFNPGSIGPRRFQLPITFGMLTIDGGRVSLEHVSCETGEKWLPPS